ncbi:hypothetical protein GCM10010470_58300 [Saccharopolyspora taberi]|uniref:Uncharacterized protein n=1 Tax=Saccharopolyspora taberi TaxID=60895 RepID=A0ABN3VL82_9PSEU
MLCAARVKIPQATPLGREPASKAVTELCPECAREVEDSGFSAVFWDF